MASDSTLCAVATEARSRSQTAVTITLAGWRMAPRQARAHCPSGPPIRAGVSGVGEGLLGRRLPVAPPEPARLAASTRVAQQQLADLGGGDWLPRDTAKPVILLLCAGFAQVPFNARRRSLQRQRRHKTLCEAGGPGRSHPADEGGWEIVPRGVLGRHQRTCQRWGYELKVVDVVPSNDIPVPAGG